MHSLNPECLSPKVFTATDERPLTSGLLRCIGYLGTPTPDIRPLALQETQGYITGDARHPEERWMKAWMGLESATPGLFSIDDSPTDTVRFDSRTPTVDALHEFRALQRQIPVATAEELLRHSADPLHFEKLLFGFKAGLVSCIEPILAPKEVVTHFTKPDMNREWQKQLKHVYNNLSHNGELLRKQIIEAERLVGRSNTNFSKPFREAFLAMLRGLEVEYAFHGAIWTSNMAHPPQDAIFCYPSSVRADYGFKRQPKTDFVLYFHDEKYGLLTRRTQVGAYPERPNTHPRVFEWFGDRDLRLPPLRRDTDHNILPSPEFAGYQEESARVRRQILSKFETIDNQNTYN